jgi:predicted aspartyl protease
MLLGLNPQSGWAARYSRRIQEVPFRLFGNHLVVITGSLGEAQSRLLLIDTGTNPSVVDRETAQELGLQEIAGQSMDVYVMNATVRTHLAVLPNVAFGPVRRQAIVVYVADLSWLRQRTGIRVDAVIGLDVLDQLKFQIDYSSRKIRFGDVPMSGTKVPVTEIDRLLMVAAQINGTKVNLMVDTGGSNIVLFPDGIPKGSREIAPGPTTKISNLAGQGMVDQLEVAHVWLGHTDFGRTMVVKMDNPPSHNVQGILGVSARMFSRITFDLGHGQAAFEVKEAGAELTGEPVSCEAIASFAACYGTRAIPPLTR